MQNKGYMMKVIIGLTGNIAAGKSTVSDILRDHGAVVVDADLIARKIVEKGEPALNEIVRSFGGEILQSDGTLDRKALGDIVFNDPDQLQKLDRIMHPRIISHIKQEIDHFRHQTDQEILTIDAALLFEAGLDKLVDQIWFVDTSEKLQLERLKRRNNINDDEALSRIKAQQDVECKRRKAQVVIQNNSTLEQLKRAVVHQIKNLTLKESQNQ
jgi:dephospho-CoA kinase